MGRPWAWFEVRPHLISPTHLGLGWILVPELELPHVAVRWARGG
ncbi:MAG TPA: hypothetical protein VMW47_06025 [Verrucomicrobiae bacterium]|nr:hypothetical protein [Verrucomicrobiae bacterium]